MPRRLLGKERMREVISYRLTDKQRAFLEHVSDQEKIGLGEAARSILNEAMRHRGIEC